MTPLSLRIVTYHRVMEPSRAEGDPALISATPAAFEAQMRHLARRYRVLSAEEIAATLAKGGALPSRSTLITFDDATQDFADVAWPILRSLRLPATVFVPTAFPAEPARNFWWERLHRASLSPRGATFDLGTHGVLPVGDDAERAVTLRRVQALVKQLPHADAMALVDRVCDQAHAVPDGNQVLSWDELRSLAADGVSLGAHTHTHAALTRLPLAAAAEEITRSRDEVHQHTKVRPVAFAYPFGDHNCHVAACVRDAGFSFAVTCLDGPNYRDRDPMRLRRINITQRTTPQLFAFRLTAAGMSFDRWRHRRQRQTGRPLNQPDAVKLAYVMSRFPKLSETFVVNEMSAMARLGVPVEVYPLLREPVTTVHPDVEQWMNRARYISWLSPRLLSAHVRYLTTKPETYLTLLAEVLRRNWGSRNLFIGALGTFPKAVQFADDAERRGVTHVHAHFATHPALAAFVVQRLTGIPYSFTAHGSDLHVDRRMLDAKVGAARFVVAVSRFNRDIIVRECGDGAAPKVHVVHCGVDVGSFAPAASRSAARGRIVCVASLEEVKGHRFLIDACALLRERGIEFVCELIGEGPMRPVIVEQIAKAGLESHVLLLGGKPRPEVISHLAAADVAVLASHPTASGKREGIPVALMEAMAVELPVVSTSISGIPELVEHGVSGLLVPSGDALALADALERLIGDDALRWQMGRAGRATIIREFDLDANARTLLGLCKREEALAL